MKKPEAGNKAVFLDRDGTIIVDQDYLGDPAGVVLLEGAASALRRLRRMGYLLFLFTNQSGVGRGYFTMEDVERVNARMLDLLDLPPPGFDGIGIAPETPGQPVVYRKPSPRYILEKMRDHWLDPAQTHMVGDSETDIHAGLAAGVRVAAVTTGRQGSPAGADWVRRHKVPLFANLPAFVDSLE